MSYLAVWVHAVWSTKRREPYLSDKIRKRVFDHIAIQCRSKGIRIDRVNGYVDHVHFLFSLRPQQSVARIMNQVKGESSRWINQHKLTPKPFAWQNDYYACSVSERNLNRVRDYLDHQEEHHRPQPYYVEKSKILP